MVSNHLIRVMVLSFLALYLGACDTMHGVFSSEDTHFPKLESKSCVEKAMRAISSIEFLKAEKIESLSTSISLKPINTKFYKFSYKIKDLNLNTKREWLPYVSIEENSSDDKGRGYNKISYRNDFSNMAGPKFTISEKVIVRKVIKTVNDRVWKVCGLKIDQPTIN